MFLAPIIDHKVTEVAQVKFLRPLETLQPKNEHPRSLAFLGHHKDYPRIIGEIKFYSPTKGPIRPSMDYLRVTADYETGGCAAISVWTDRRYFRGDLEQLKAVRQATQLPVIRKDFIINPYQIIESADAGADAVIFIATALEMTTGSIGWPDVLEDFLFLSREAGTEGLVQVENANQLKVAVKAGARYIILSNRRLKDLRVDHSIVPRLAHLVPPGVVTMSLGGYRSGEQIAAAGRMGIQAVFVGTALMKAQDQLAKLRELGGLSARRSHPAANS